MMQETTWMSPWACWVEKKATCKRVWFHLYNFWYPKIIEMEKKRSNCWVRGQEREWERNRYSFKRIWNLSLLLLELFCITICILGWYTPRTYVINCTEVNKHWDTWLQVKLGNLNKIGESMSTFYIRRCIVLQISYHWRKWVKSIGDLYVNMPVSQNFLLKILLFFSEWILNHK